MRRIALLAIAAIFAAAFIFAPSFRFFALLTLLAIVPFSMLLLTSRRVQRMLGNALDM